MATTTTTNDTSRHGMWSSRWLFILAAAGSAVGLGNIWKFPYIVGDNGGGAFVLIYLVCVLLIGVPIMMAEVMLGRAGRLSPINSMGIAARMSNQGGFWVLLGWAGAATGLLILSYYSMIAGWTLYYIVRAFSGTFVGANAVEVQAAFDGLLSNPGLMLGLHSAFMAITIYIASRGVASLEFAVRWLMPALMLLLVVLVIYGFRFGDFNQALTFMFQPDWGAALRPEVVLEAMGHAFFTLSVGMGAIMAYGAYVPGNTSVTSTVATIAILDTVVAIAAGLAIFPLVFAHGLEPGTGPGLMFVTLPLAFGQMPFGSVFGAAFFLLVSFAALTSAISLTEPVLAYLVEEYNAIRSRVAISVGVVIWLIGIGSVLSFNWWSDFTLFEKTYFDLLDHFTQNIMLPLGGLAICLFTAWLWNRDELWKQLGAQARGARILWYLVAGIVAPAGVVLVFMVSLFGN